MGQPAFLPADPHFILAAGNGIDDILAETIAGYGATLVALQPMKTALEGSEPYTFTLVNVERPAAFGLEPRCGKCNESAVAQALDAFRAASPKIPFTILK